MSVERGLNSTNVDEIKEARATAKGKVTKNITFLKNALVCDANGKFLLDEIDEQLVRGTYEKLDTCHDTFQMLHTRFCFFRIEEKDPTTEAEAKEREKTYSEQVSTDLSSVMRQIVKFKRTKEKEAEDSAKALEAKEKKEAEDSARAPEISIQTKEKETEKKQKILSKISV